MLTSAITRVVDFCTRYPLWIIVLGLGLATGSSFYAARHFAIKTDVYDLLSPDLPWNQDRSRFLRDFPQREILVVVDAPTPEGDALDRGQAAVSHASDTASEMAETATQQAKTFAQTA
jgi:predicted RND superfamily exporter protein